MKNLMLDIKNHVLTGISYMIPLVIAGAVIMAISRVGASFMGITDIWDASHLEAGGLEAFLYTIDGFGGTALGLMFPVISAFIAYSVSDKLGIAPGLVGVSEGAIPFAVESPLKVIPVNVIGSAIGAAMAVGLGAVNQAPISGFYGWFTVQNWPIYVASIAVGVAFVAIATAVLRSSDAGKVESATVDDSFDEDEWNS